MAKEFIDFQWTSWNDDVGESFAKNINYEADSVNSAYDNYESAVYNAESVLSSAITYDSQEALILALEVRK